MTSDPVPSSIETLSGPARLRGVLAHRIRSAGRGLLARVGVLRDRARVQPLMSENLSLARWMASDYGTPGKPAALAEVPWDYVRANEDRIPFLGLREYWYPALRSRDLRHNEPVPTTLLGDALVFFRDADGRAVALEDRCTHRNALLSLGQVGVWSPGTITCRYHGMTFDGEGTCVGVITDGPSSRACGNAAYAARKYPTEELGGVVWVYMGESAPASVLDSVPHAREVFQGDGEVFLDRGEWPFSYLSTVDNDIDLAHPAVLHRTCLPFSEQKVWGEIAVEERACGGLRTRFTDGAARPHAGALQVDEVEWHLPNIAWFAPGTLGGPHGCGYFWAVPRDVGSCARWFMLGGRPGGRAARLGQSFFFGQKIRYAGSPLSCSDGADAAMMASQGRVPRWDTERLLRTDVGVSAVRRRLMQAHEQERAAREVPADSRGQE